MKIGSNIWIGLFVLTIIVLSACSSPGRLSRQKATEGEPVIGEQTFCDSAYGYKTLYINKIKADVLFDDEAYGARVMIYYEPDSLIVMSAVNAGFEIIRMGMNPDSSVIINRLEKKAYILKNGDFGYLPPINFEDMEFMLNRAMICKYKEIAAVDDTLFKLDRSVKNVVKRIQYTEKKLTPVKFEFFQKKTGEYVVGEYTDDQIFVIYWNYIIKDLELKATGGNVQFDRKLDVQLGVNRDKYDIIYL